MMILKRTIQFSRVVVLDERNAYLIYAIGCRATQTALEIELDQLDLPAVLSPSKDGTSGGAGLRVHVRLIQQSDKSIGEIPFNKMVDYRVLEEVRQKVAH